MEEGQKKTLMIGIIVVCLVVAGYLAYANFSGGSNTNSIPADEMVWVKCTDKACQAEYQMNKREYHETVSELLSKNPMATFTPLKCEKCGKDSVLLAEKCQNPACGTIFISNSIQGDFPDRCPKCKQSATEESRKQRKAQGGH